MRRAIRLSLFVPLLATALVLAGCTSGSTTQRTVTVVNSVTSSSAAVTVPKTTGSAIVVSSTAAPSGPRTTPKPTPSTSSAAPVVKVDPLKVDCAAILGAADIKAAIGVTVTSKTNRVRLGAAGKGLSGAIRCLYGSPDGGKTSPVRVRLTQYSSAAAAKAQIGVDTQAAQDAGATITSPMVNGYPATLQLIAGGVLEMQYDTWTLAVAVSDKLASAAVLTKGLPILAGQALVRVIKNG